MKKSSFDYVDDDFDLTITVKQATVLDGLQRAALTLKLKDEDLVSFLTPEIAENPGIVWYLKEMYVATTTLTVDIKSNDPKKKKVSKNLSFEDMLKLPEALQNAWHMTIIGINPQLVPTPIPTPQKGETAEEAGEEKGPSDATSS